MLDEMEGRIRVSVVATGIDAEAFAGTKPENVQVLHPKQTAIQRAPAPLRRPEVAIERANPVHARQEVVEREMARAEVREHARAETREMTRLAAEEPIMLGGMDAPAISEAPQRPQHQAREMREVREQRELRDYRSAPPPKRGGVFGGLFGRPRTAVHMEPTVPPPRPRATAQVVTRAQSAAPQQPLQREPERRLASAPPVQERRSAAAATPLTETEDDLFAGQGDGTDFEIPAFLRRHANSGQ
jgi:cell division protein FtsZ